MKKTLIPLALLLALGLFISCGAEAEEVDVSLADDAQSTGVAQPNAQELIGSIVLSVVGEENCDGKPCYWIEAIVVGDSSDEDITIHTLLEIENNLGGVLDVIKRAVIQVNAGTALELALPELVQLVTGQMSASGADAAKVEGNYQRVGTIAINLVGREEHNGEPCHWIEATVTGATLDEDITVHTLVALENNLDDVLDVIKRAMVQVNSSTTLELALPELVQLITGHMGGSTPMVAVAPATSDNTGPTVTPGPATYEEGQVGPRINRTEEVSTDSGEGSYSDSSSGVNDDEINHENVEVTEGGKPISVLSTSVFSAPFSYQVKFHKNFG
ncbi:hypothetical protein K8R78_08065 [bacterium]|nr:hypothetical protein [bacterium]